MPSELRIIRRSSFAPKPWKNGGGVTYEAAREPTGGDSYVWRVSVAHVDSSGPFSDFSGHHRTMVLLRGNGVELSFADSSRRSLRHVGEMAQFDGGLAAHCTLVDGPCVDFNLIVAKTHTVTAEVLQLAAAQDHSIGTSVAHHTLLFAVDNEIRLSAADGQPAILQPGDLALMAPGGARTVRLQSPGGSAPSAVFFARISH